MKKIIQIAALLFACGGCAGAEGESNVVSRLNALSAKQSGLPESLVRPASLLIQEQYLHKPWDKVHADLVKQGLSVPEGQDTQYMVMYDIPVATNVLHVGDIAFDLVLEFEVDKRRPEDVPTARLNHILTARASLRAPVEMPTAQVISSGMFPTNSVLGRALLAPARRERDGGHPVLKRIEMSYDLICGHRESEWPYGYHLSLFFGRQSEDRWRKRIFLTVLSSEDLPRDREHNEVKNWQGWMYTGLDDIQFWGSNGE